MNVLSMYIFAGLVTKLTILLFIHSPFFSLIRISSCLDSYISPDELLHTYILYNAEVTKLRFKTPSSKNMYKIIFCCCTWCDSMLISIIHPQYMYVQNSIGRNIIRIIRFFACLITNTTLHFII